MTRRYNVREGRRKTSSKFKQRMCVRRGFRKIRRQKNAFCLFLSPWISKEREGKKRQETKAREGEGRGHLLRRTIIKKQLVYKMPEEMASLFSSKILQFLEIFPPLLLPSSLFFFFFLNTSWLKSGSDFCRFLFFASSLFFLLFSHFRPFFYSSSSPLPLFFHFLDLFWYYSWDVSMPISVAYSSSSSWDFSCKSTFFMLLMILLEFRRFPLLFNWSLFWVS